MTCQSGFGAPVSALRVRECGFRLQHNIEQCGDADHARYPDHTGLAGTTYVIELCDWSYLQLKHVVSIPFVRVSNTEGRNPSRL